ncbi:tetratricopeptide repeat protein [bacterium]|nr:tetratricopeptide repeat protein [bacterium]
MAWCQLFCHLAFSLSLTTGLGGNQQLDFQRALIALEQSYDFEGAAQLFQSLQDEHPGNNQYTFFLGKAQFRQGRLDEAIACFESCIAAEPGNAIYHLWASKAYGRKVSRLNNQGAGMTELMPWGKKVKAAVEKAVELDPNSVEAQVGYAVFLRETPGLFGGDVKKARQILTQTIADHPDCLNAHFSLAELYLKKDEDYDAALREYKFVADHLDDSVVCFEDHELSVKALLNMGFIYYKRDRDLARCVELIRQHLELKPNSQMGYLTLGEILVQEKRWGEAREALSQAREIAEADDAGKLKKKADELLKEIRRKAG